MRPPLSASRTVFTLRSPPRSAPVLSIIPVIALTLFLDLLWVIPRPLAQLPCNFLRRRAARCWTDSTGDHCSRICGLSSQIPAQEQDLSECAPRREVKCFKSIPLLPRRRAAIVSPPRFLHLRSRPWVSLATRRTSSRPVATTVGFSSVIVRLDNSSSSLASFTSASFPVLAHNATSTLSPPRRRKPASLRTRVNKYSWGRLLDMLEATNTGTRNNGLQIGVPHAHRSASTNSMSA